MKSIEVEQFEIKVVLIGPGVIKSNAGNNFKIGKRLLILITSLILHIEK
jgi:hypothetical protein